MVRSRRWRVGQIDVPDIADHSDDLVPVGALVTAAQGQAAADRIAGSEEEARERLVDHDMMSGAGGVLGV